ncbi:MAG: hypothetical protein JNL88_02505 [Bacteroidia bacterium]|nr:hypothetical protein [Bacteroidia bacterium]
MNILEVFTVADHLNSLKQLSIKAGPAKKDSCPFYQLGARNFFFKLEAIARIFRETINEPYYDKIYNSIKLTEDALGQYDYQKVLADEFVNDGRLPDGFRTYFKNAETKGLNQLNLHLEENGWIPDANVKCDTLLLAYSDKATIDSNDFLPSYLKYLSGYIQKLEKNFREGKTDPEKIEEGVHELRRKLRWISIYTQVSGGIIQLTTKNKSNGINKKYLDPSILNSPFMKVPHAPKGLKTISIHIENFAALSWIINELGVYKDQGLRLEAINRACLETVKPDAANKIQSILNPEEISLDRISEKVRKITTGFFNEDKILSRILDDLKQ